MTTTSDLRSFTLGCEGKHIRPECWKSTRIDNDGRVAKACPECGRFMGFQVPSETKKPPAKRQKGER